MLRSESGRRNQSAPNPSMPSRETRVSPSDGLVISWLPSTRGWMTPLVGVLGSGQNVLQDHFLLTGDPTQQLRQCPSAKTETAWNGYSRIAVVRCTCRSYGELQAKRLSESWGTLACTLIPLDTNRC